jgi:hypothetical protein
VIETGVVEYGPEVRGLPATRAIRRLRSLLREHSDAGSPSRVEIVYVIPGSLGRADFRGVMPGHASKRDRKVQVLVAVPEELVHADAPEAALVKLTRQAVARGADQAKKLGIPLNSSEAMRVVDQAAAALSRLGPANAGPQLDDEVDGLVAEAERELGLSPAPANDASSRPAPHGQDDHNIEVHLPISNGVDLDSYFELEEQVRAIVAEEGDGRVEGNEVGDRDFVIFLSGQNPRGLAERLRQIVRRIETPPGSHVVIRGSGVDDEPDTRVI